MRNILQQIERGLTALVAVGMILLFGVILLAVFFRYVLSLPLTWSEETVQMLSIWMVLLGAAVAVGSSEHLRVDVLDRYLARWSARSKAPLQLLLILCEALFAWSLLVGGWFMARDRWEVPQTTVPLNQGWVYIAAPIAAGLMLVFLIVQAWDQVKLMFGHRG
jgi:TRAP-type C4-dicarboxylate transport system permease small subunit